MYCPSSQAEINTANGGGNKGQRVVTDKYMEGG